MLTPEKAHEIEQDVTLIEMQRATRGYAHLAHVLRRYDAMGGDVATAEDARALAAREYQRSTEAVRKALDLGISGERINGSHFAAMMQGRTEAADYDDDEILLAVRELQR